MFESTILIILRVDAPALTVATDLGAAAAACFHVGYVWFTKRPLEVLTAVTVGLIISQKTKSKYNINATFPTVSDRKITINIINIK